MIELTVSWPSTYLRTVHYSITACFVHHKMEQNGAGFRARLQAAIMKIEQWFKIGFLNVIFYVAVKPLLALTSHSTCNKRWMLCKTDSCVAIVRVRGATFSRIPEAALVKRRQRSGIKVNKDGHLKFFSIVAKAVQSAKQSNILLRKCGRDFCANLLNIAS